MKKQISVIIPVFNEKESIKPLFNETKEVLESLKRSYEILIVDDASRDGTIDVLKRLKPLTIIAMRKNAGQSSAFDAGIKHASGELVVTMDGDGQNDPHDIPHLINTLEQGNDVVCGWRKKRKDSVEKRFISKGAEFLRSFLVDDGVHDAGCSLRVYKKECFDDMDLYGEMHRMIPAMLKWRGFKVTEVEVNHRPRAYGNSKYTWKRTVKGFLDMLYIWFWRKFAHRPLHFFGGLGLLFNTFGIFGISILAYLRLVYGYGLSDKIWPLVSFFFILVGVQLLATGLIAAQLVQIDSSMKYYIAEIISNDT